MSPADSAILTPAIQLTGAALVAFVLCAVLYPLYIKWLRSKQVEQFLREDGPESHKAKAKTPTMGGVVFTLVTLVLAPLAVDMAGSMTGGMTIILWGGLFVAFSCFLIGFIDDYAKVASKSNVGISGYMRLALETILGIALGALIVANSQDFCLGIPLLAPLAAFLDGVFGAGLPSSFEGSVWPVAAPLFVLMSGFLVAATANAVNLHDGMDGLCAGTASQIFAALAVMLLAGGQLGPALISAVMAGALCGFLLFNKNPASIFMGDTGSLFIGGLMAALVIVGGLVIWFVPLALIYIVEALSVIMQVLYFKLTKTYEGQDKHSLPVQIAVKLTRRLPGQGKRLFRMAPLHHHYEAVLGEKGVPEWQVVALFWLVQLFLVTTTLLVFRFFSI